MPFLDKEKAKEYHKNYYEKNKKLISEKTKIYREKNKDKIKNRFSKYYDLNKEIYKKYRKSKVHSLKLYMKEYRKVNKEIIKLQRHKFRQEHKEEIKKYKKEYKLKKCSSDPNYKLRILISNRLLLAIKKQHGKKSKNTINLLGCNIQTVRTHLEKQFVKDMNWTNHGNNKHNWQIDHIVPCSHFDLTNPEDQIKCFHYTNLQPLWFNDNENKLSKLPTDYINGQRLWDDELGWIVGIYAA